jgi:hypothetical protein
VPLQVNGTHDVFQGHGFGGTVLVCVHTCPDCAIGVVQDFRGDRTQEQSSKRPVTMGWHHDQISLLGMSALDNVLSRIAFNQNFLHRQLGQLFKVTVPNEAQGLGNPALQRWPIVFVWIV